MPVSQDPGSHIPLRPVEFDILLVLAGRESHGYGIIKEVEEESGGANRIATGTLYRALRRLTAAGLVKASGRRKTSDVSDEKRRFYALTSFGRDVATAEARRLATQVDRARAKALLAGFEGEGGVG